MFIKFIIWLIHFFFCPTRHDSIRQMRSSFWYLRHFFSWTEQLMNWKIDTNLLFTTTEFPFSALYVLSTSNLRIDRMHRTRSKNVERCRRHTLRFVINDFHTKFWPIMFPRNSSSLITYPRMIVIENVCIEETRDQNRSDESAQYWNMFLRCSWQKKIILHEYWVYRTTIRSYKMSNTKNDLFLERQGFEKIDRSQPTKVIIQNGYIVLFLIIQGVKRYKTIGIDVASTKSWFHCSGVRKGKKWLFSLKWENDGK